MRKLNQLVSTVVPMLRDNVDTDQIIPARFLKATNREGFGENLFRDWRFDSDGNEIPDFELNDEVYTGEILLVGENFGCGSSREHAAWAIADYGFRVVIAKSFADIFKGNALNNGLLPIQVPEGYYNELVSEVKANHELRLSINLQEQEVQIEKTGAIGSFEIPAFKKECLLQGLDDLDYLIGMREEIEEKLLSEAI